MDDNKNKTLLVIDNDEETLKNVDEVLIKEGYTTFTSSNLETSYSIIDSNQIDMVLLDIHSLMKNGIDAYEALKSRYPDLSIVVTSHNS